MADFSSKADELVGRAKQVAGDVTGNDDLHAQGVADEARANVKQGMDAVADKAEEAVDAAARKAEDVKESVVDTAQDAGYLVRDNGATIVTAIAAVALVAVTVLVRRRRKAAGQGRRSAVKRATLAGVGHALTR